MSRQPISQAAGIGVRSKLDAELAQESAGAEDSTVHGIPPFTIPRADGTLEPSMDIRSHYYDSTSGRMMRRRQGDSLRSDQDGDGNHTNNQGYRDGHGARRQDSMPRVSRRRPIVQRIRKAFFPTLICGFIAWFYDAMDVLVYRADPRIKGGLLSFSLLSLSTVLSIFFYLEYIRPRLLKMPTNYVNWENELLYPVRIATTSLVVGMLGATVALWPVWHLSTAFVLPAVAVAVINVLSIVF